MGGVDRGAAPSRGCNLCFSVLTTRQISAEVRPLGLHSWLHYWPERVIHQSWRARVLNILPTTSHFRTEFPPRISTRVIDKTENHNRRKIWWDMTLARVPRKIAKSFTYGTHPSEDEGRRGRCWNFWSSLSSVIPISSLFLYRSSFLAVTKIAWAVVCCLPPRWATVTTITAVTVVKSVTVVRCVTVVTCVTVVKCVTVLESVTPARKRPRITGGRPLPALKCNGFHLVGWPKWPPVKIRGATDCGRWGCAWPPSNCYNTFYSLLLIIIYIGWGWVRQGKRSGLRPNRSILTLSRPSIKVSELQAKRMSGNTCVKY